MNTGADEDAALADVVLLLERWDHGLQGDENYTPDSKADLMIVRNRYGPTGSVALGFIHGRYTNAERPQA